MDREWMGWMRGDVEGGRRLVSAGEMRRTREKQRWSEMCLLDVQRRRRTREEPEEIAN